MLKLLMYSRKRKNKALESTQKIGRIKASEKSHSSEKNR